MVMDTFGLVSVLMSYYRETDLVIEAIESVRNQSYTNIELVVVCDGGPEIYLEKLRSKFAFDSRIRFFWKENSGLTESLKFGLTYCQGYYLARIDADDIWHQKKLERQLPYTKKYDIIGSHITQVDEENVEIPSYIDKNFNKEFQSSLYFKNSLVHSSVVLKTEYYRLLNPSFKYAQDYALWLLLLKSGKSFYIVEDLLVTRRILTNSIGKQRRLAQQFYVLKASLKYFTISTSNVSGLIYQSIKYVYYLRYLIF